MVGEGRYSAVSIGISGEISIDSCSEKNRKRGVIKNYPLSLLMDEQEMYESFCNYSRNCSVAALGCLGSELVYEKSHPHFMIHRADNESFDDNDIEALYSGLLSGFDDRRNSLISALASHVAVRIHHGNSPFIDPETGDPLEDDIELNNVSCNMSFTVQPIK